MFSHPIIRFVFYPLVCIFTYGCNVVPREMKTAERLMETEPDSALQILKHLPPLLYASGSSKALYGLLLARALDKNMLPLKPDTLLDFSLEYYLNRHDHLHSAACYLYKGRMVQYVHQYVKASHLYLSGLDEALTAKDEVLMGRINFDMGSINGEQGDYAQAREKYRSAYTCFMHAGFQPQAFYALLNIGRTYSAAKDYKNALLYYRSLSKQAKDSLQRGALLQEVGLNFYKSQQVDSALFYFRRVIHYPFIGNNRAIRYQHLADLYFDLNQPDSAYFYAKNAFTYKPNIRTQRECYRILVNCVSAKGDLKVLKRYMMNYQDCNDSVRKIDAQTKGSILESMHILNKQVIATKNNGIVIFVLFILVILGSVFFHFRRIHRYNFDKHLLEESNLKLIISYRKEVIRIRSQALFQKMEEVKLKQTAERKKASFAEKERLDLQLYKDLLYMNDIDCFYHEMDKVLYNLPSKLHSRYPALTHKEICWCCFQLLQLPTTDIYLLLDYKLGSLTKMKQRLVQKTGVSGVNQLYDFLDTILAEEIEENNLLL